MELDGIPGLLSRQPPHGQGDFKDAPRSRRCHWLLLAAGWGLAGIAFNLTQRALDPALDWLFQQWEWTRWLAQ
jgi:hypothetical protein